LPVGENLADKPLCNRRVEQLGDIHKRILHHQLT
jgi:hypothetical protein